VKEGDVPTPGLKSTAAALLTPFDMVASGIESMASTLEAGSKEMYQSAKAEITKGPPEERGRFLPLWGRLQWERKEKRPTMSLVKLVPHSLEKGATVPAIAYCEPRIPRASCMEKIQAGYSSTSRSSRQ